jgi:hypothetical protein
MTPEPPSRIETRAFLDKLHLLTPEQQDKVLQKVLDIEKAYTGESAKRSGAIEFEQDYPACPALFLGVGGRTSPGDSVSSSAS